MVEIAQYITKGPLDSVTLQKLAATRRPDLLYGVSQTYPYPTTSPNLSPSGLDIVEAELYNRDMR